MRHLPLLAILALAACSEPSRPAGQAQQGQSVKPAAPAVGPDPVVPANAAATLALDTRQPGADAIPGPANPGPESATVRPAAAEPPTSVPADTVDADASPTARAINQADVSAKGARPPGWTIKGVDPGLVRLEVLLDRAGFSPGVIDGKDGQNLKQALAAYASAKGVDEQGARTALAADTAPAVQSYAIAPEDVAGPFIGDPPKDYEAMARLPAMAFSRPQQLLAEKFHMDQTLLQALNPGVDWTKAGAMITVAAARTTPRAFQAARVEVDKSNDAVRAYNASGALVAYYPATVGSTERPAPSGAFKVTGVARHPVYFYDPKRLTFTPQGAKGKLRIAPGPNNPVGETWIALNIPTYGIHGTPDPAVIGKRQSHGCVRLTNWDAVELGKAVKRGVKVEFVGSEKRV